MIDVGWMAGVCVRVQFVTTVTVNKLQCCVFGRWMSMFWRNLLPPSSVECSKSYTLLTLKMEGINFTVILPCILTDSL